MHLEPQTTSLNWMEFVKQPCHICKDLVHHPIGTLPFTNGCLGYQAIVTMIFCVAVFLDFFGLLEIEAEVIQEAMPALHLADAEVACFFSRNALGGLDVFFATPNQRWWHGSHPHMKKKPPKNEQRGNPPESLGWIGIRQLGGGNSNFCYFHPYLWKIPILTDIFQLG